MDTEASYESFPLRPKIVFMGTPEFAVPTLDVLIHEGYDVVAVVTQPDRPKGRGRRLTPSPIKVLAEESSLTILQPERLDDSFLETLLSLKPELLVVVAFGQIIPGKILRSVPWGGINVHASLLPRYRGSAPIQWAVINNERETGLTTMFMDEGMDTGPILLQQKVDIFEGETAGELHDRLSSLAPGLLIKTLGGLSKGSVQKKKQDDSLATYTSKLTKEHGILDWSWPAERLCGLVRGLDPWPGAFTFFNKKVLKLYGCSLANRTQTDLVPGRIRGLTEGGLEIETGKGFVTIREIQVSGKKRLPAQEYMRGSPLNLGSILGNQG
jgi:methionyl-tRNA formyltransferase